MDRSRPGPAIYDDVDVIFFWCSWRAGSVKEGVLYCPPVGLRRDYLVFARRERERAQRYVAVRFFLVVGTIHHLSCPPFPSRRVLSDARCDNSKRKAFLGAYKFVQVHAIIQINDECSAFISSLSEKHYLKYTVVPWACFVRSHFRAKVMRDQFARLRRTRW